MIEFTCPSCRKSLRTGPEMSGRACRCPHCQGVTTVPARDVLPPTQALGGTADTAPLPPARGGEGPPTPEATEPAQEAPPTMATLQRPLAPATGPTLPAGRSGRAVS